MAQGWAVNRARAPAQVTSWRVIQARRRARDAKRALSQKLHEWHRADIGCVAFPGPSRDIVSRFLPVYGWTMVSDLDTLLRQGKLHAHFQPIVDGILRQPI